MGICPTKLVDITPCEFNLLREGYQKKEESEWERARFQAWINYAMQTSGEPVSLEEFHPLPSDKLKAADRKKLPSQVEINADYKAEMEAKMNIRK